MTLRANQIAVLASAIERVRRFDTPADNGLSAFFRAHHEIGQRDRAFVADGVFALLRRQRSLEALAESAEPRKLALAVLVRDMGLSLRELEPALNAADALWVRTFKSRLARDAAARRRARPAGLAVGRGWAPPTTTRRARRSRARGSRRRRSTCA